MIQKSELRIQKELIAHLCSLDYASPLILPALEGPHLWSKVQTDSVRLQTDAYAGGTIAA
jgi:hypothetical protein